MASMLKISLMIVLACLFDHHADAQSRPNIFFIMLDDHAYQAVSAYGYGLNHPPQIDRIAQEGMRFDRCLIHTLSNAIPGIECVLPGGAFYAFPNVSKLYGKHAGEKFLSNSDDFAAWLLEEARVAVVPGFGFGADDYIRLSYAASPANIEKGLAGIAELSDN